MSSTLPLSPSSLEPTVFPRMKDCPFCGKKVDLEDPDTLYPNGTAWVDHPMGLRTYQSFRNVPKEQWCYSMNCPSTAGGCDAEVTGDTIQEAIDAWNRRQSELPLGVGANLPVAALQFNHQGVEVGRIQLVDGVWHFIGDVDLSVQTFVVNEYEANVISTKDLVINLEHETLTAKQPIDRLLMAFAIKLFKEYNAIHY